MKTLERIIFSFIILATGCFFMGFGFRCNLSSSLPNFLYFSIPNKKIDKNKIVSFQLPQSPVKFAKRIVGIPGDLFEIDQGTVYINGIIRGQKGQTTNLEYTTSEIIPEGFFFAIGEGEDSFDSRYAMFGLVPIESIKDELWPIF